MRRNSARKKIMILEKKMFKSVLHGGEIRLIAFKKEKPFVKLDTSCYRRNWGIFIIHTVWQHTEEWTEVMARKYNTLKYDTE